LERISGDYPKFMNGNILCQKAHIKALKYAFTSYLPVEQYCRPPLITFSIFEDHLHKIAATLKV
jgi:hypothetical protein